MWYEWRCRCLSKRFSFSFLSFPRFYLIHMSFLITVMTAHTQCWFQRLCVQHSEHYYISRPSAVWRHCGPWWRPDTPSVCVAIPVSLFSLSSSGWVTPTLLRHKAAMSVQPEVFTPSSNYSCRTVGKLILMYEQFILVTDFRHQPSVSVFVVISAPE